MTTTTGFRAALAVGCAMGLLAGCSADGDADGGSRSAPMGWIEREDEATGVRFALPPPISGPEDTRRPGRTTAVASRSYGSRTGDLRLSVQFLSTPEDPEALSRELPPRRVPSQVLDQIRTEGDFEGEVLSNDRVEALDEPAYDAQLEVSSGDEEAVWWMRTRALADVVVVIQVVGFVEGEDTGSSNRAALEAQGAAAFQRLNQTVAVP